MDQEPREPEPTAEPPDQDPPPPFDPDPRLVTYLERGRKSDAKERFQSELERQKGSD
jgi:hypothetical protein